MANLVFAAALRLKQLVAPAAPKAGENTLYFKADDKLYSKNTANTEVLIGPTGGSSPTGAAGGDLTGTYPNPTVVKSLADFAVGGNVTVGTGTGQVIIPTTSMAKGRLQSLPGIPNWIGYTLNAAFNGTGWDLDDTTAPGWFFKLDGRAPSTEYSVWFIPSGANPHTDERLAFKVDSAGVMTVANRITGVGAPSGASDAIRHDDTRLSDSRAPTAHTHVAADVASGNLDTARLGASPAATTYLKGAASGAATWVVPATVKTDLALNNVANVDQTNASNLATGTVPQARLGASGTRDTTTFLRGDNTFNAVTNVAVTGPIDGAKINSPFKEWCKVATTANLTLSGTGAGVDGSILNAGDRILVKDQTNASENGIYVVAAGAWTRAPDADTIGKLAGAEVSVSLSGPNIGITYRCPMVANGILGTAGIYWNMVMDVQVRSVRVASTTNIASLAAVPVAQDGVTLVQLDRILLTGQTTASQNGVYILGAVSAGAAPVVRDRAYNTSALVANAGDIAVTEGTLYGGTSWRTSFKTTDTIGTTSQAWAQYVLATDTRLAPVGSISMFAGTTAPTGWFLCTGGAVSRTTFAALFAIIGTTYGAGDGSTTFNVPDLQSRFPMGVGTSRSIGANEGLATAVESQRSARFEHRHTHAAPLHSHNNSTLGLVDGGTHTHAAGTLVNSSTDLGQQTNTQVVSGGSLRLTTPAAHAHTITGSTNNIGSGHTHGGITGAVANNVAANTDQQGIGGQDAAIAEHPYLAVNFIIKA